MVYRGFQMGGRGANIRVRLDLFVEESEAVPGGPLTDSDQEGRGRGWDFFTLWLAQGFGVGRIPFGPGTFGSMVGLAWFALLALSGSLLVFAAGTIGGFVLSVWLCGEGERILKQRDPGSVVLDEIAAMPVCFAGWVWMVSRG